MNGHPVWIWFGFAGVMTVSLAVDLYVHRAGRNTDRRSAILWSLIWIGLGIAFGGVVWVALGTSAGMDYFAAYLMEKSLSVDNLFVFLMVFQALNIPTRYQRKVLTWGIFGALIMRGLFVWVGAAALRQFHWMAMLFGALLLWAAIRTWRHDPAEQDEARSISWLKRHLPVTSDLHQGRFLAREEVGRVATPLLVAVIALELTDVVFAFDSVPAAFSVTRDEFLVYSSNAFAILGLRSLYAVLAKTLTHLRYLHYGLALVLGFAGLKLIVDEWVSISAPASIVFIVLVLTSVIVMSLRCGQRGAAQPRTQEQNEG